MTLHRVYHADCKSCDSDSKFAISNSADSDFTEKQISLTDIKMYMNFKKI